VEDPAAGAVQAATRQIVLTLHAEAFFPQQLGNWDPQQLGNWDKSRVGSNATQILHPAGQNLAATAKSTDTP
jgi:hypothetical protein